MPINPVHFIVTVLLIMLAVIFATFIVMLNYDRRNRQATDYLSDCLANHYAHGPYWGDISSQVAQEIFRELYSIPWSSVTTEPFWHDEYVDLLKFFLAICEDGESQVNLIYGTLEERRRKCRHPLKKLIWMEYTHDGHDWILWVDPDRADPDGSLLRNDGYKIFHEFGEVHNHATYNRHDVCRIVDKHTRRTN